MHLVATDSGFELVDATNFKAFYVDAAGKSLTELGELFEESAGTIRGEHAWITRSYVESALAAIGGKWEQPFDAMVTYADSKGWVSRDAGVISIRAHIENH